MVQGFQELRLEPVGFQPPLIILRADRAGIQSWTAA